MFLLLAPLLLTGKRLGLYCPRGQRSQDAPKGPKGELRCWIARLDKELHSAFSTHIDTDPQNKSLNHIFSFGFTVTFINF